MSSVAVPPLSPAPAQARWKPVALFVVIASSACTAPLFDLMDVTFTGDRLLGLLALGVAAFGVWRRELHWTPIHTALAVFTAIQIVTSLLASRDWPAGPKFSSVYLLGWACFALVAAWAGGAGGPWGAGRLWIGIGAVLGVAGSALAVVANYWQVQLWGVGQAEWLIESRDEKLILFATKFTFDEWNLYSSFLLVAFALGLWWWSAARDPRARRRGFLAVAAIAFGLVFGMTRAAWVGMALLLAFWLWSRRPGWRAAAAIAAAVVLAFSVQALAVGEAPLYWRVVRPLERGKDKNIAVRGRINDATITSWMGFAPPCNQPGGLVDPVEEVDDAPRPRTPGDATATTGVASAPAARPEDAGAGAPGVAAPPTASPPAPARADTGSVARWASPLLGRGAGSTNSLKILLRNAQGIVKPWNGNLVLFVLHDSGIVGLTSLAALVVVVGAAGRRALRRAADAEARGLLVALLGAGVALLWAYQFTHGMWIMYTYVYLGVLTAAIDSISPRDGPPVA